MTVTAGCLGFVNTGPAEITVETSVTEPVEVMVLIQVLPSELNDLNQNKALINQTKTVEPDERWVLREQSFNIEGDYFISVRTSSGLSTSETISDWRSVETEGIEIWIRSEDIEISTVID